jgi:hypothetical protein
LYTAPDVADGVEIPRSNPARAVPALVTPEMVKPVLVVIVLVVIPIVATLAAVEPPTVAI